MTIEERFNEMVSSRAEDACLIALSHPECKIREQAFYDNFRNLIDLARSKNEPDTVQMLLDLEVKMNEMTNLTTEIAYKEGMKDAEKLKTILCRL